MKSIITIMLIATVFNANAKNTYHKILKMQNILSTDIKTEEVTYTTADGTKCISVVAYDAKIKGKRPIVLVIPEWWGLTDYAKSRAKQLAELGYLAMAVDMFGDAKIAANPTEAQAFTKAFYGNPNLGKSRIDAALQKIKTYKQADKNKVAAIGYCFGGSMVLNAAKLGEDFKGVVSFHGGLKGVPADKKLLKAKILVCHGAADKFVNPDVPEFKKQLDSIKADYIFKEYEGATHAFTNPEADVNAKKFNMPIAYNPVADKASWIEMKLFFKNIFK